MYAFARTKKKKKQRILIVSVFVHNMQDEREGVMRVIIIVTAYLYNFTETCSLKMSKITHTFENGALTLKMKKKKKKYQRVQRKRKKSHCCLLSPKWYFRRCKFSALRPLNTIDINDHCKASFCPYFLLIRSGEALFHVYRGKLYSRYAPPG